MRDVTKSDEWRNFFVKTNSRKNEGSIFKLSFARASKILRVSFTLTIDSLKIIDIFSKFEWFLLEVC